MRHGSLISMTEMTSGVDLAKAGVNVGQAESSSTQLNV